MRLIEIGFGCAVRQGKFVITGECRNVFFQVGRLPFGTVEHFQH